MTVDDSRFADLHPPADVRWIADTLSAAGFEAWAVGGAVRDALRGVRPDDWDLTTSARPSEVRRLFRRTVPIGIEHGTVGVIGPEGRMYEVTTFRRDVETDGRHARVAFSDRLEEDLERRDFTINAVAWNPRTREVRDPHGGMADLERRLLRTVGDPERRFEEDRLRVLRALRFAGRFHMEIEPATWAAIVNARGSLSNLSPERVREELWKVLSGQATPSRSLTLYAAAAVLEELFPELEAMRSADEPGASGRWERSLRAADAARPGRPLIRLAALLHSIGEAEESGMDPAERAARSGAAARNLMRRLRHSNADTHRVMHLITQHLRLPAADATDADLRRWIRRIGVGLLDDLFRLLHALCRASPADPVAAQRLNRLRRRARGLVRQDTPLSVADLTVDGGDLRRLGIPPGPLYGEILEGLLERVTDDPTLNDREVLLRLVRAEMDR